MARKAIERFLVLAFISFFCMGSGPLKVHRLTGRTMGTTYQIKIVTHRSADLKAVQQRIDRRLEQLNQSFSTYRKESEISRFNQMTAIDRPYRISADFLEVMKVAKVIHQKTNGAWDGTINPLVKLWGFGRPGTIDHIPSRQNIALALKRVDFSQIEILPDGFLKKHRSRVTLDLASIAKGYGVDVVSRMLKQLGYGNHLVEIGGEVFAAGRRSDGKPWLVGINLPRKGAAATAVYKAVSMENLAMATSGDYRNYIEIGGRVYSHIIDPRTGYPVNNGVVSVTVVAPNCTVADGLATGLMVMGADDGIALINRIASVEGLIIVRRRDGALIDHWSKGMPAPSP